MKARAKEGAGEERADTNLGLGGGTASCSHQPLWKSTPQGTSNSTALTILEVDHASLQHMAHGTGSSNQRGSAEGLSRAEQMQGSWAEGRTA